MGKASRALSAPRRRRNWRHLRRTQLCAARALLADEHDDDDVMPPGNTDRGESR